MEIDNDPVYMSQYERSYSRDDWRGRLLLGILRVAIEDFLNPSSSIIVRRQAKMFLFEDNVMLELCLNVLGYDSSVFRRRMREMSTQHLRLKDIGNVKRLASNDIDNDFDVSDR